MIDAIKIRKALSEVDKLLETLGDRKVGGFAYIVPPEGDTIEFLLLDDKIEPKSYYALLMDRIKQALEQNRYGGVNMPPGMGMR